MVEQKGFRGNPNLKRKGHAIEWTSEMIEEYIRCKDDIFYFIEKYYRIVTEDGLVPMQLRDYQRETIASMVDNRFTMLVQSRQSGKALCLETPILTPSGFKPFKDIHKGDIIYSVDGKKTKVVFETETMFNHDCYNIKFSHGDNINCDKEHVWTIDDENNNKVDLTTEQLIELVKKRHKRNQSVRIKIPDPIQYEKSELLIDPYVFGLWLGDGTSQLGYLTCHEDDLLEYQNYIDVEKITEDNRSPKVKTVKIRNLISKLRNLEVLNNKHIPESYIFNSIENRVALIQGLMDTDGTVSNRGSCEFSQKKFSLVEQFRFILSTLGVKSTIGSKIIKGETYYTVSFCNRKYNFFRLKRKLNTIKEKFVSDHPKNYYFYIKSIEKIDSIPVKCIQVENQSHLFLCGKTLIPTHNTEAMRAFLCWYIIFNDFKTVAIVANKESAANEVLTKIQLSYQHLPYWLQHSVTEFNKGSFVLENESRIFCTATSANSLRSWTVHVLVIDEAAHIDNWTEFYQAVQPTVAAGKQTKLIMASTPNGLNHFYEFYENSSLRKNINGFKSFFIPWWLVPGRDEKWKEDTLNAMNHNLQQFAQEYDCVDGNTMITIRNKTTDEITTIPINSFFNNNLITKEEVRKDV